LTIEAIVASSARSGAAPPFERMEVCPACLPVRKPQRDGAQTDEPLKRFMKRIPSAAMRSTFGVWIVCPPM
jgi:hypothetical protein